MRCAGCRTSPAGAGDDSPLLDEVASIRAELSALRRRPLAPTARLEDDQLDWLAAAVAERVADLLADQGRREPVRVGDAGRRPLVGASGRFGTCGLSPGLAD